MLFDTNDSRQSIASDAVINFYNKPYQKHKVYPVYFGNRDYPLSHYFLDKMETRMSYNTSEIIRLSTAIELEKMTLDQYVDMLRCRINKGYMPSSTSERKFNTKPNYVTEKGLYTLCHGSGYYSVKTGYPEPSYYEPSVGVSEARRNEKMLEPRPLKIKPDGIYFGVDSKFCKIDNSLLLAKNSTIEEIMIITDLNDPINNTYVNVLEKLDSLWLGWTQWTGKGSMKIPINPYELEKHLDIYT